MFSSSVGATSAGPVVCGTRLPHTVAAAVFSHVLRAILLALPFTLAAILLTLGSVRAAGTDAAESPPASAATDLPVLDLRGPAYRTPRAGEGFRTEVFGRAVTVEPRDRRSVSSWDLGLAAVAPGVSEAEVLPFGSLYFWRQRDRSSLLRAIVAGFFNQLQLAKATEALGPLEVIAAFENLTVPFDQAEYVDGERLDDEELVWGRVHLGIGLGYRRQLEVPGHNDNMLEIGVLAEPGFLYFDAGSDMADDFLVPRDTVEMRGRLRLRLDKIERNLLGLPHVGFALGSDLVGGHRANWDDWGRRGAERAGSSRDYVAFSGYVVGVGGVPFLDSDRHRLLAALHGGTGNNLDRFSRFRLGGGPHALGEEYEASARPVIPGALIEEFTTSHYAGLVGEYRWEPIFFTHLSLRASASYVNRERLREHRVRREDDTLFSLGARITTGMVFEIRLQLDYNYNTEVVRDGEFGGHEVTMHFSRSF